MLALDLGVLTKRKVPIAAKNATPKAYQLTILTSCSEMNIGWRKLLNRKDAGRAQDAYVFLVTAERQRINGFYPRRNYKQRMPRWADPSVYGRRLQKLGNESSLGEWR
jgi:hypothetical protein